jgi:hypothetical protein
MDLRNRWTVAAAVAAVALVGAGTATGYELARTVNVPPRGSATFLPSYWSCFNRGRVVECHNGDAFPFAELTSIPGRGGITVKVHTLRPPQAGHMTKTYVKGYPVYVFTAL